MPFISILYNDSIKIENTPEEAYEYVVNGKSAIEWILDLLLSVINVSVQTVDIVNSLPKLTFETNQEMSNG